MRFLIILALISVGISSVLKHPNSMKTTIDYTKNGGNWIGMCKSGTLQSPISIDKYNKVEKNIVNYKYGKTAGKMEWNGSYYRLEFADSTNVVNLTDPTDNKVRAYNLKRVIFRTPAEHKIDGVFHDLEIQFIHEGVEKETFNMLNISVFSTEIKNEKLVDEWWKNIDVTGVKESDLSGIEKLYTKDYYYYNGSQTVPNCVENVRWVIFKEPIKMHTKTMNSLRKLMCSKDFPFGNSREVQKADKREITLYNLNNK